MLSVQRIFPENEKSYDQKEHIRDEGKSLAESGVRICDEYRKTGDTAKRKVIGELEKVDTYSHDQRTDSE